MIPSTVPDVELFDKNSINDYVASIIVSPIRNTIDFTDEHSLNTNKEGSALWAKFRYWFVPELVLDKLDDVYSECSRGNWDGHNAEPITEETYREAIRVIRALPSFVAAPDILPEPDGGIGLGWENDSDHSFAISLSGNSKIDYTGLFGDNGETYGTERFTGTLPKIIIANLERLFPIPRFSPT